MKLFIACIITLLYCPRGYTVPVDGTAALIGKDLITVNEVQLFKSLLRFKEGKSPAVQFESGDELKRSVQRTLFEELVYRELKALESRTGAASKVDQWLETAKKKRSSDWKDILKQFQITERVAVEKLNKNSEVELFLQKKVETMTPLVTDEDIKSYFQQNENRFKGSTLESMKANIAMVLKKEKLQKGFEEWIAYLKDKYVVRTLIE